MHDHSATEPLAIPPAPPIPGWAISQPEATRTGRRALLGHTAYPPCDWGVCVEVGTPRPVEFAVAMAAAVADRERGADRR